VGVSLTAILIIMLPSTTCSDSIVVIIINVNIIIAIYLSIFIFLYIHPFIRLFSSTKSINQLYYLGNQFEAIVAELVIVPIEEWPCNTSERSIGFDIALKTA
jgi:hypothetical protein